jgi:hypothetical protein
MHEVQESDRNWREIQSLYNIIFEMMEGPNLDARPVWAPLVLQAPEHHQKDDQTSMMLFKHADIAEEVISSNVGLSRN